MNLTKMKSYFGFAVKSNKVVYGTDNILQKKPYAVFISEDLSLNAKKKLVNLCESYELCMVNLNKIDMEKLVSSDDVMAFGVKDKSLADAMINCLN